MTLPLYKIWHRNIKTIYKGDLLTFEFFSSSDTHKFIYNKTFLIFFIS